MGIAGMRRLKCIMFLAVLAIAFTAHGADTSTGLKIATFDVDATPPVGSMMAYDKVLRQDDLPLRCRGVVLLGAGEPIVLCALDWIGLANEGHDLFCEALARAAGTTAQRVAAHTLHQHDAPDCDFSAEKLLKEVNHPDLGKFDGTFERQLMERTAAAIRAGIEKAKSVAHVGFGDGEVEEEGCRGAGEGW